MVVTPGLNRSPDVCLIILLKVTLQLNNLRHEGACDWTAASRGECGKETHKDMSETWLITVAINKTVFL